jgi:FtsH-binding integral membrane protein
MLQVVMAFILRLAISICLKAFAGKTQWDFTRMGGALFSIVTLISFVNVGIFIPGKTNLLICAS